MSGLKKRKAPAPRSAARIVALAQVQESLASGWDGNLANKRKKNVSDLKGQDDSSHPVSEGKEQKTEAVDSADTSNSNSHTLPTDFFDANADDELDAFEREVAAISSSEHPPAAVRKEADEVGGDAVDAVEEAVARINADAVTRSNDWERLQDWRDRVAQLRAKKVQDHPQNDDDDDDDSEGDSLSSLSDGSDTALTSWRVRAID